MEDHSGYERKSCNKCKCSQYIRLESSHNCARCGHVSRDHQTVLWTRCLLSECPCEEFKTGRNIPTCYICQHHENYHGVPKVCRQVTIQSAANDQVSLANFQPDSRLNVNAGHSLDSASDSGDGDDCAGQSASPSSNSTDNAPPLTSHSSTCSPGSGDLEARSTLALGDGHVNSCAITSPTLQCLPPSQLNSLRPASELDQPGLTSSCKEGIHTSANEATPGSVQTGLPQDRIVASDDRTNTPAIVLCHPELNGRPSPEFRGLNTGDFGLAKSLAMTCSNQQCDNVSTPRFSAEGDSLPEAGAVPFRYLAKDVNASSLSGAQTRHDVVGLPIMSTPVQSNAPGKPTISMSCLPLVAHQNSHEQTAAIRSSWSAVDQISFSSNGSSTGRRVQLPSVRAERSSQPKSSITCTLASLAAAEDTSYLGLDAYADINPTESDEHDLSDSSSLAPIVTYSSFSSQSQDNEQEMQRPRQLDSSAQIHGGNGCNLLAEHTIPQFTNGFPSSSPNGQKSTQHSTQPSTFEVPRAVCGDRYPGSTVSGSGSSSLPMSSSQPYSFDDHSGDAEPQPYMDDSSMEVHLCNRGIFDDPSQSQSMLLSQLGNASVGGAISNESTSDGMDSPHSPSILKQSSPWRNPTENGCLQADEEAEAFRDGEAGTPSLSTKLSFDTGQVKNQSNSSSLTPHRATLSTHHSQNGKRKKRKKTDQPHDDSKSATASKKAKEPVRFTLSERHKKEKKKKEIKKAEARLESKSTHPKSVSELSKPAAASATATESGAGGLSNNNQHNGSPFSFLAGNDERASSPTGHTSDETTLSIDDDVSDSYKDETDTEDESYRPGKTELKWKLSQVKYSPSKNAATLAAQRNKKECARKVVASSKAGKLQRRKLRLNRSNAQETSELREGTTFSSACTLATGNEDIDTESIPAPVTAPSFQPLVWNPEYVTVCFDLETTSLFRSSQLTQIAARVHGSDSCPAFSIYLLPTEVVSLGASRITGLAVATIEGERVLTANGKRVTALSQRDGLQALIDWLENLSKSVVLVAHNCHGFDMRVLSNALMREGLQADFGACVHGFGDSLPALKCALPSRSSYTLAGIHMSVCKHDFPGHDASHDVTALVDVLRVVKADLVPTFVTVGSVITVMAFEAEKLKRQATFGALVKAKVLSPGMASKAAASGLTAHHLQVAYRRDSALGIECLFKEKTAVGCRVTAAKRIISGVNEFLSH